MSLTIRPVGSVTQATAPTERNQQNNTLSQNMAVFTVFTHNESTKYKTTVCSKSMLFVVVTTFMTVLLPLMFAYRSQGFWIKTLSYREQPVVHFKNEYFIYLETDKNTDIIICSTIRNPSRYLQELDRCSSIKFNEEDINGDGILDKLVFQVNIDQSEKIININSVYIVLVFDVVLQTQCLAELETIGVIQAESSNNANKKLHIIGDLELVQRALLPCRGRYLQYNQSAFNSPYLNVEQLVLNHTLQNVSTRISAKYTQWWRDNEPTREAGFSINLQVMYTEATINYRPGFWPVMKWAWIQYLPFLVIFIVLHRWIKKYVFLNHLLPIVPDRIPKKKLLT